MSLPLKIPSETPNDSLQKVKSVSGLRVPEGEALTLGPDSLSHLELCVDFLFSESDQKVF